MKKDYSKIFYHYYGLKFDNNVNDMIAVHKLMEEAGIDVSATTEDKLNAYSDKRPFKVHYFISKQGSKLKWCPTNSADKLAKMDLKPASWWFEQLEEEGVVLKEGEVNTKSAQNVNMPKNWLDIQLTEHIKSMVTDFAQKIDEVKEEIDNLPF